MSEPFRLADLPGNFATFICQHLFDDARPIGSVGRDHDGDLIVSCFQSDHGGSHKWHLVGFGHMLQRDPTLGTLPPLHPGEGYERTAPGLPWIRNDFEPKDGEESEK